MRIVKGQYPNIKIYFLLFVIYYVMDVIFPYNEGDMVDASVRIYPQIAMGLIFAYSLYYFIINFQQLNKIWLFRPFILLLIIMAFYIPFSPERDLYQNFIQFMKMNTASISLFGFYLSIKKTDDYKLFYNLYIVMLLYGLFALIRDYYVVKIVATRFVSNDLFDSHSGFMLASLIPMTLMLPAKKMRAVIYIILVVATMLSGQRAASIGAIISLPFALKYIKGSMNKGNYMFLFIIGVTTIIVLLPAIETAIENIMLRQQHDADRGSIGSGRGEFYMIIIKSFFDSSLFNLLFGYGYFSINALLKVKFGLGISAHNGFLEHLYTFGFLGFFVYLFIFINIYRFYRRLKSKNKNESNLVLMMLFVFLIRSVAAHGNLDITYIPFFMPIAILLSKSGRTEMKVIKRDMVLFVKNRS